MEINEKEYLCVELSILLPKPGNSEEEDSNLTSMNRPLSGSQERFLETDSSPFPTPPNFYKIVLFQGAVPYTSLYDVYVQKGLTQNALKMSWSRLSDANKITKEPPARVNSNRVEYIMMRGPRGKGQCQVAITNCDNEAKEETHLEKKPSKTLLKMMAGSVKALIGSDKKLDDASLTIPIKLRVSMTYVNVPWQSIVNDLLDFAKSL